MGKSKKSKEERKRDRDIVEQYHQKLTEDLLETLYKDFLDWKKGSLPYYELTENIHEFHKKNQKIWSMFNLNGWDDNFLIFQAKKELNLLEEKDKEKYAIWLNDFDGDNFNS
ncbi:hypothetical protein [Neobacillus cucumis]|uniref:hypothetical protein n=1 Tax=Neobacillus cucumis TaxID=1740721 RepID=UPI001964056D|nr:hypothetical protein [Neobacillus cucumis]MBM7653499.1 hypothetical protein [Neobacillus cucumis]